MPLVFPVKYVLLKSMFLCPFSLPYLFTMRAFAKYAKYGWNLFDKYLVILKVCFSSLGCYDCIPKEVC